MRQSELQERVTELVTEITNLKVDKAVLMAQLEEAQDAIEKWKASSDDAWAEVEFLRDNGNE